MTYEESTALMVEVCEGNPGALSAMRALLDLGDRDRALNAIRIAKSYGITGPNLWLCYKDICRHNAYRLMVRLEDGSIADDLEALPYHNYINVGRRD